MLAPRKQVQMLKGIFRLLLFGETILILSLTDHTDCTDFFHSRNVL